MPLPHLLITGAAGRVASAFIRDQGSRFSLRLADMQPIAQAPANAEVLQLDIRDAAACARACEGMDLVLHLAADASPQADFLDSLLPVNVLGCYQLFAAAAAAGCQKLVFASSAQVIEGYPLDEQIAETALPRPANMYGVTKAFGEALAAYFAKSSPMNCVAVRIANVAVFAKGEQHSARDTAAFISERDLAQLLQLALLSPVTGFALVNAVSDNRYKRLSLSYTRQLLGYQPEDDAFAILSGENTVA